MKLRELHPWPTSPQEAIALQRHLAAQVVQRNEVPNPLRLVGGLDISPEDPQGYAFGAAVVLRSPDLAPVEVQVAKARASFPYIPGLLAFREIPVLQEALARLTLVPDVFLVDGQGLAHPRRFGIACHLGLLTDVATVGCAKSILRGRHGPLEQRPGAWSELVDEGEVVGAALRTRAEVAPVYVSVGHKMDLPTALSLVMACCRGYRVPEPTRLAHLAAAGKLTQRASQPQQAAMNLEG